MTTKPESKPLALIDVTSAMQVRISTVRKDGQCVDLGVSISKISAQHLAYALLEYATGTPRPFDMQKTGNARKTTVIGKFQEDFKEKSVVYLRPQSRVGYSTSSKGGSRS